MLSLALFLLLNLCNATELSRLEKKTLAPYYSADQDPVPNYYVVRLNQGYTLKKHFRFCRADLSKTCPDFEELPALRSYRAQLDNNTMSLVRTDPGIEYVEQDHYIVTSVSMDKVEHETYGFPNLSAVSHPKRRPTETIKYAPWNVRMITTPKKLKLDPRTLASVKMLENRGRGVNAYVMDTGVRITHETFQGRASNFMGQTITPYCSGSQSMNDIDGHGTAVASILAGSGGFGISFANIINVKIWCQRRAAISSMAKAISDITAEHQTNVRQRPSWFKGSIINLSSQTLTFSPTLRDAVAAASDAGIAVLVSAGNDGQPAYAGGHLCRLPTTICVTSCDSDYSLSSFANHGVAVDIIAPGGDVPVATPEDDESVGGIRGTSFAVPIVGGVLATFIGNEDLITDLRTTRQRLFDNALRDVIGLEARSTTPNLLVNIPTNRLIWPSGLPYVGAPASSRQCSSFPGCLRPS